MDSPDLSVQASASATSTADGTSVSGKFIFVTQTPRHRRVQPAAQATPIPFTLTSFNSFSPLLSLSDDEDEEYSESSSVLSDSDDEPNAFVPADEAIEYLSRKTVPLPSKHKKRRDPSRRDAAAKASASIYTEVTGRRKRRRVAPVSDDNPFAEVPTPPIASGSAIDVPVTQPVLSSHRSRNPIYLFYTQVDSNPYRQSHAPNRRDRHYRSNFTKPGQDQGRYYTITPAMHGSTTALTSHLRVHFPDMYKLYEELKSTGRAPTLQEVRIAQNCATPQEVTDIMERLREKADAILASFEPEVFNQDVFEVRLGEYVTAANLGFDEVRLPEFERLLQTVHGNDKLQIPSADTMRRRILGFGQNAIDETRAMLREYSGMVGIALDAWTSSNGHAFLAIVMQYLDEDWNIQELLIDFKELIGEHSGENLAKVLWSTLEYYGLVGRVMAIMADNASNNDTLLDCIEARCKLWNIPFSAKVARVRCPPHTIHLSVLELLESIGAVSKGEGETLRRACYQDSVTTPVDSETANDAAAALNDGTSGLSTTASPDGNTTPPNGNNDGTGSIRRAVIKLRTLVRAIRSSPQRRELWYSLIEKFPPPPNADGTPQRPKLPILDCPTRWSSLHQMLERASDYIDAMDVMAATLSTKDNNIHSLSGEEWTAIRLVTGWLKSFRKATTRMSTANTVTLSTVHLIFRMLQDELIVALKNIPSTAPPCLQAGLLRAHRKLSDYYLKYDVSPFYTWAALLDPRISLDGLLNDCQDDVTSIEHVRACKQRLEQHFLAHYASSDSTPTPAPVSRANSNTLTDADLFAHYDSASPSVTPSRELVEYFALNPADARALQLSPTHWWRLNQYRFPCLSKLARDIFSIPGSAVSVERVFSGARDTLSLRRASLSAETLRMLMLYKHKLLLQRRNREAAAKGL